MKVIFVQDRYTSAMDIKVILALEMAINGQENLVNSWPPLSPNFEAVELAAMVRRFPKDLIVLGGSNFTAKAREVMTLTSRPVGVMARHAAPRPSDGERLIHSIWYLSPGADDVLIYAHDRLADRLGRVLETIKQVVAPH